MRLKVEVALIALLREIGAIVVFLIMTGGFSLPSMLRKDSSGVG
jgi:hypothetical protein